MADENQTQDTGNADAAAAQADAAALAATQNQNADKAGEQKQGDAAAAKVDAWGDKWREEFAGEDAKLLGRLKRYAAPKDAIAALIETQNKVRDGSYKKGPTDKSTPEEIAEYRQANGIPEKPEGYFEKLPDGLVIGEEDKPIFDEVGQVLHGMHVQPGVMHAITKWYYDWQDRNEAAQHEANVAAKAETEDAMRDEWGPDYRANLNVVNNFVGSMPQELQDMLYKSTTADGKQIMNSPLMMKWLATQARELNYTGKTLPSGETNAKGIDKELAEITALMGNHESKYWKGPEANKLQQRWRELTELQEKLKARAA